MSEATEGIKKRYVSDSAILGKLLSMLVRRFGRCEWTMGPGVMAAHLQEMGITAEKSDAEIETALGELVESGVLIYQEEEEEAGGG